MSIDGNHILYHYLQKNLRANDEALFESLVARLIANLGVWFSPRLYSALPVILPHVIRDANCRPRSAGDPDEWGSADGEGYCRDDNSLVKGLPKALSVESSTNALYHGQRLGNGFVASHAWRSADTGGLAAKRGWTNTFIPNLVWLPVQVAKLTDRAGSFAQNFLQAIAYRVYRAISMPAPLQQIAERAWAELPRPTVEGDYELPAVAELSFFVETDAFMRKRVEVIQRTGRALATLRPADLRVLKPSRYGSTLAGRSKRPLSGLADRLDGYLAAHSGNGQKPEGPPLRGE